jgi:lipid-A-disaccharide synthase
MVQTKIMLIAGEASGDALTAELVMALERELPAGSPTQGGVPKFFGAGGQKMAGAGVELLVDMTQHSVIGLIEALKNYHRFKKLFDQLLVIAIERKPDLIVCVDFSGFNRRFAHAVKNHVRNHAGASAGWNPKIVQYVSPQVWASRPQRAAKLARDIDLLLCLFAFEKDWYTGRLPNLRVEFVGHPLVDRYANAKLPGSPAVSVSPASGQSIILLPGSRLGELKRHLLVMLSAAQKIYAAHPTARFKVVLPTTELKALADRMVGRLEVEVQVGGLGEALSGATLAIASTGTVTLECAYFGVPTIAIYKTSWSTYQIGKRIIQVKFLAMPNLLANEIIFPELIQHNATPENIAAEAIDLLTKPERREGIKLKLKSVVEKLGPPGASDRAAKAIANLLKA